jgi:hypothetical protein
MLKRIVWKINLPLKEGFNFDEFKSGELDEKHAVKKL